MIWIIQRLYSEQVDQLTTPTESSKEFPIRGCVLSPRVLRCVGVGHARLETSWTSFWDQGCKETSQALTDLRFADDILLFALSPQKVLEMLRSLVLYLRQVGLVLNASKTKLMTTQAQPPDRVWFQADSYIDVVHGNSSHKWFWAVSCPWMVTTLRDVEFHFYAAALAFWANRRILRDRHVP